MKTRTRGARPRTWLGPALILVGIALLAGALYWYFHPVSHELVGGGIVSNPFEPPDFTLTDQFEHDQRLGNLRGRPIALTFVYTNCPDVCPLIAANMHAARYGRCSRPISRPPTWSPISRFSWPNGNRGESR